MRAATTILLLLLLLAPVQRVPAAPMPETWSVADVTPADSVLYTVEAGRFLSPAIGNAVAQALRDLNFAPVRVVEEMGARDMQHVVYVGCSRDLVELYGLRDELISQKIADGRVVPVPAAAAKEMPAAQSGGKLLPAFVASSRLAPKNAPTSEETIRAVTEARSMLDADDTVKVDLSLRLLSEKATRNPEVSAGLVLAAKRLYDERQNPEIVLAVLAPVSRGEIAATPDDQETARELTIDLYLSHRGDWRAAWRGWWELSRMPNRDAGARAGDLFRLAMLKVVLLSNGETPAPSFASIRNTLQEAYSAAPEADTRLRARIMLLYVQSFAWQGAWDRVEVCGNEFFRTLNKESGLADLAAIYVARSFERTEDFGRALKMLESVIGSRIDDAMAPRSGMRVVDLKRLARAWREYFVDLEAGAEPGTRPPDLIFEGDAIAESTHSASTRLVVPKEMLPAAPTAVPAGS